MGGREGRQCKYNGKDRRQKDRASGGAGDRDFGALNNNPPRVSGSICHRHPVAAVMILMLTHVPDNWILCFDLGQGRAKRI